MNCHLYIKIWRVGVLFGIVATLSSRVDVIQLPNDNDISFEPRGEGKLHKKVFHEKIAFIKKDSF